LIFEIVCIERIRISTKATPKKKKITVQAIESEVQ